jgi:hypothetical protein
LGQVSERVRLSLYASSAASVAATITIIAFFTVGQPWGSLNDFSYGVQTLAMIPILFALGPAYRQSKSGIAGTARIVGVVGILGLSIFSFLEAFGPISVLFVQFLFFIIFDIWFLLLGAVLKGTGMRSAMKMSLVAMTSLAYPVWAFWLARQVTLWSSGSESMHQKNVGKGPITLGDIPD